MKRQWLVVLGMVFLAGEGFAEESTVLKTQKDKVNYAIGVNMISNIKQQGVEIDLDLVMKGMKDAYAGGELLLSDDELRKSVSIYMAEARQQQEKARMIAAEENMKASEAFLAENAKKEGVVTLPSGLQYKILKAGGGRKPTDADTVECNYRGTLANGTEFDSSYRTGKPATFKLSGELIPGMSEALKLMPAGSTWQIFIPPRLAYGERSAGPIGPNAALIFEVELLGIK